MLPTHRRRRPTLCLPKDAKALFGIMGVLLHEYYPVFHKKYSLPKSRNYPGSLQPSFRQEIAAHTTP